MNNLLAARFADTPVMVAPSRAGWMAECLTALSQKIEATDPTAIQEAMAHDEDWWGREGSFKSMLRPYKVENGVLSVPVKGMLMHDFSLAAFDLATGYDYIQKAFERGMADENVEQIAMVINSGGGEVAGNFDLVDRIHAMRGQKPITAVVNEHAYSAAFSLASAADRIIMPRTGGVGSVGVVTSHIDQSKRLEDAGIKVTFIHAGEHKVEGNSASPLTDAARDRLQARVDGLYQIFVETVARNLGLSEEAVKGTEALTYSADAAMALGFAHEIRAFDEAMAALGGRTTTVGAVTMSQEHQAPVAADQASLDAARAEGRKEGMAAERERIQGILASEEAKGRDDLAFHLSMNTDLSVEQAAAILGASPVQVAAPVVEASAGTPGADFVAAMANGNPDIQPEVEPSTNDNTSAAVLADYRMATGQARK